MGAVQNLTDEEFARIATIVEELEAENDRLRAENEVLVAKVRDLEFCIGWRERNGVTTVYGRESGGFGRQAISFGRDRDGGAA